MDTHKIFLYVALCTAVLLWAGPAEAIEYKASGMWQFRIVRSDRNLKKNNADDKFRSANRLKTQINVIASEALEGVVYFTIGHQNWGKASEGAALGTDSAQVRVDKAYIDWAVPRTQTRVRMGLQRFTQPTFTDINSPIIDIDAAGITLSTRFNEALTGTLFWFRPANDNAAEAENNPQRLYRDNMDIFGASLPMSFGSSKVTPWAMYGMVGRDSFTFKASGTSTVGLTIANANLLPLLVTPAMVRRASKAYGDLWFGGITADIHNFDPLRISFDAAYGSLDVGSTQLNGKTFDVKRSGWYSGVRVDYHLKGWTPGIIAYYASGDDANPYNGSERMPAFMPDVYMTSYGFDGTWYSGAAQTLGYGLSGTWAVMGRIKDVSFLDNLKHTLRLVYYRGTNDPGMIEKKTITNLQATQVSMSYLTNRDSAVEVNVDTTYKMYENLLLGFELGYIRVDLDKGLWDKVGYRVNENNWKIAFSASLLF